MGSVDYILEMMEFGNTLHAAVFDGNVDLVRSLLDKEDVGLKLNDKDKHGRTLLHYAVCRGQREIVELILDYGADPNTKDRHGNTPLHWCGHIDVLDLLISHKSQIDSRNCLGATPKDMAKRRGVAKSVIEVFELYENEQNSENSSSNTVKTLFHEFSDELGVKNLILLLLVLVFISVYVAYTITRSDLQRAQPIILHS